MKLENCLQTIPFFELFALSDSDEAITHTHRTRTTTTRGRYNTGITQDTHIIPVNEKPANCFVDLKVVSISLKLINGSKPSVVGGIQNNISTNLSQNFSGYSEIDEYQKKIYSLVVF